MYSKVSAIFLCVGSGITECVITFYTSYTPPSQLAIYNLQFLLLLISSSLPILHSKLQHFRNFTTSLVMECYNLAKGYFS